MICSLAMSHNEGDILASSFAVKVSELARMYPKLVIGREGDIFMGLIAVKVSEPARISRFRPIRNSSKFITHLHKHSPTHIIVHRGHANLNINKAVPGNSLSVFKNAMPVNKHCLHRRNGRQGKKN